MMEQEGVYMGGRKRGDDGIIISKQIIIKKNVINFTFKVEVKSSALWTVISLEQSPWVWTLQGIKKSPGRDAVGVLSKHSGTSRPGSKRSTVNVTPSSSAEQQKKATIMQHAI